MQSKTHGSRATQTARTDIALANLDLRGPYILVAHSMGALTSRAFAAEHLDEVAGVVLVDPRDLGIVAFSRAVFPEQPALSAEPTLTERWLGPLAARLGVMRLANMLGIYVEQLPAKEAGRARATLASARYWDNFIPDALLGESAIAGVSAQPSLGDVPLIVLSAGEPDMGFPPDSRAHFIALHEGLAQTLSSRGGTCWCWAQTTSRSSPTRSTPKWSALPPVSC